MCVCVSCVLCVYAEVLFLLLPLLLFFFVMHITDKRSYNSHLTCTHTDPTTARKLTTVLITSKPRAANTTMCNTNRTSHVRRAPWCTPSLQMPYSPRACPSIASSPPLLTKRHKLTHSLLIL